MILTLNNPNDLSNHNIVENKRTKVNNTLKLLREFKSKPRYKDKYGNNVKQHFGIYKYFINTQNQEKEKFYISREARKVKASEGKRVSMMEDQMIERHGKHYFHDIIRKTEIKTQDKARLEYWGLPAGICDQFYKHTKIQTLFPWQQECLSKSAEVL